MIGIVAAMDAEILEFEKRMDVVDHTKTIAGCTLTYGKWQGKDVVLCKSGVGKGLCGYVLYNFVYARKCG